MADEVRTSDVPEGAMSSENLVPADSNPALVDTAKEVIAGQWGRGNVRKNRLKLAGFDPAAVQREVDKIFNR
jgi:hypothetical protein